MAAEKKSSKVATRGAKQIVEENGQTLNFYRNMVFVAVGIYLTGMLVFFEFHALEICMTILCGLAYLGSYQFMMYMARAQYSQESGQLLDSGVDLNMEGGIAEHFKDLIILTVGVQVSSLISNYCWLVWLAVPARALWMLWSKILSPWFFSGPVEQPDIDEKKQRKMERKMAKRQRN